MLLLVAVSFIFFVVRGCVATQESTQIRKYVTSSDSMLAESATLGNERLQGVLAESGGDPAKLDRAALREAADRSEDLYLRALQNEEVPPEFRDAHHYLTTTLGIRAEATRSLVEASSGDADAFQKALATAVEDYRLSDSIAINHYVPAVQEALDSVGQRNDSSYLEEPEPFMDYDELGFDAPARAVTSGRSDPNALHGVEITSVEVGGQPLYPGGSVVLTASDKLNFTVTVTNGGEVAETAVPVEVILNTEAERQSQTVTIERIEPNGGTATVELTEFRPGEYDETAEVTVEAGPVKYEEYLENNTLTGSVTFGL